MIHSLFAGRLGFVNVGVQAIVLCRFRGEEDANQAAPVHNRVCLHLLGGVAAATVRDVWTVRRKGTAKQIKSLNPRT